MLSKLAIKILVVFFVTAGLSNCTAKKKTPVSDEDSTSSVASASITEITEAISLSGCGSSGSIRNYYDGNEMVVSLTNSSSVALTDIIPPSFSTGNLQYKGGIYPGVGGTCTSELESESNCTMVLELKTDATQIESRKMTVEFSANGEPSMKTCDLSYSSWMLVGQLDYTSNQNIEAGLYLPTDIFYDGTHTIVADGGGDRVLIWNSVIPPSSITTKADVVLGRPDFKWVGVSHVKGIGGMRGPVGVFSDGTRLFVADRLNNRVLIWKTFPTENGQFPDVVLGQDDFDSVSPNKGAGAGSPSRGSLYNPFGVYFHQYGATEADSKLLVTDTYNNRILVWDGIPSTNGADADYVIGQPGYVTQTATCSSIGLSLPMGITGDSDSLIVADRSNDRVLTWNITWSSFAPSNLPFDYVTGQPNDTTCNSGTTQSTLYFPYDVFLDSDNKLYISDTFNSRVVVEDMSAFTGAGGATTTGNFNLLLMQPNYTSNYPNWNGSTGSPASGNVNEFGSLRPFGIFVANSKLWVVDYPLNRITYWNNVGSLSDGEAASGVIGQRDLQSSLSFARRDDIQSYHYIGNLSFYQDKTIVVDNWNHRVLIQSEELSMNSHADTVIGQANLKEAMRRTGPNNPDSAGPASGSSLFTPVHAKVFSTTTQGVKFVISDYSNHRLLVWNGLPSSNTPADYAIGQPNLTSISSACTSTGFNGPAGIAVVGDRLFVTDYFNHRILVWNTFPADGTTPASFVMGQNNFTTCTANKGGGLTPAADSLNYPWGMDTDGEKLVVADYNNLRVLLWNNIPTSGSELPNAVLGQPNFTTRNNLGATKESFSGPTEVSIYENKLFLTDQNNNRVLGWSSWPQTNGTAPNLLFGQVDFTSKDGTQTSRATMKRTNGIAAKDGKLYVTDGVDRIHIIPIP